MKYVYWACLGIIVAMGIAFSIHLGNQPQSLPKITYRQFEQPFELAEAITEKLQQELKGAPLVMLGVMPGRSEDLKVWKAFLAQTSHPELKYLALVVDPDLPGIKEVFPEAVEIDLKKEIARFIDGAKNARSQGIRMAVIVPTIYASQVLSDNPVSLLKKTTDLKPVSFSLMGFPRSPEQETKASILCVMGPGDHDGTGALGCVARDKARALYHQKSAASKYEGLVELVGENDYLVLFNSPE